MTQVIGMSAVSGTPTSTTNTAPLHTEVQTLRSVGIPTETLRVTAPTRQDPKPAAPKQRLTARPVSTDRYDAHHADLAFGGAA